MIRPIPEPTTGVPPAAADGSIVAEYLDFRDRSRGILSPGEIAAAIAAGRFVWIDIDTARADPDASASLLPATAVPGEEVRRIVAGGPGLAPGLRRGERTLHVGLVVTGGVDGARLDVLIGDGFLITAHRGPCAVVEAVRRDSVADFEDHARSPSFLVYEIFEEVVERLLAEQSRLDDDTEETRRALAREADEGAFEAVAAVSSRLLAHRRRVLPVRRLIEELVSRKTTLVSEATIGFLGGMIGTLERLLADIAADREILESSLNLALTVTSHRTNRTMNRLAVVSTIFLPLTFLCGVYGMNFDVMPETRWTHGYLFFWVVSGCISLGLTLFLRRARLL